MAESTRALVEGATSLEEKMKLGRSAELMGLYEESGLRQLMEVEMGPHSALQGAQLAIVPAQRAAVATPGAPQALAASAEPVPPEARHPHDNTAVWHPNGVPIPHVDGGWGGSPPDCLRSEILASGQDLEAALRDWGSEGSALG